VSFPFYAPTLKKKITKTGNACRYIPDATGAVYEVLKQMTEEHKTKRKRYGEEDIVMLDKVSKQIITKETLKEKLAEHVEQVFFFFASITSEHKFLLHHHF